MIVNDPTKPPTQDNIKRIVEIKFPPDKMDEPQQAAYEEIAGDPNKVVEIGPDHCDCDKPEPDRPKIPVDVEDIGTIGTLLGLLMTITGRKPPRAPTTAPAF